MIYKLIWTRVAMLIALFVGLLSAILTYLLTCGFTSVGVGILTGFFGSFGFVVVYSVSPAWRSATYIYLLQLVSPMGLFLAYFIVSWTTMILPHSELIIHSYSQIKADNSCEQATKLSHQSVVNVMSTVHYFPLLGLFILFVHTLIYVANFDNPTCFGPNSGIAASAKVWITVLGYSLCSIIFVTSVILAKFEAVLSVALKKIKKTLDCATETDGSNYGNENLIFSGITLGFVFVSLMSNALEKLKVRILRKIAENNRRTKYKVGIFYFINIITATPAATAAPTQPNHYQLQEVSQILPDLPNNVEQVAQNEPDLEQARRQPDGWED